MKHHFSTLTLIYQQSSSFNQLKHHFNLLENLNQILTSKISKHLIPYCHVGALEENEKSLVVIYVTTAEAFHILRNLANHILQLFAAQGYNFDNILIKVRQGNFTPPHKLNKPLDAKSKAKLTQLANLIGNPKLIQEKIPSTQKELEINL